MQLQSITCATEQPEVRYSVHIKRKCDSAAKLSTCYGILINYVTLANLLFPPTAPLCYKQVLSFPQTKALSRPLNHAQQMHIKAE